MLELLWLLLPVAALSGWWIGRRDRSSVQQSGPARLPGGYLQGINYLLSEQQDKAIEVFTHMVEVDSDTAELHLALGSLFRRRGEVDRAIRIHQNLIARPAMSKTQRAYALLELGRDYMTAGLLDRAESLFTQVVDTNSHTVPALQQLLTIYQLEKDWPRAISTALRLDARGVPDMRPMVAQFCCEQAEQAWQAHDRRRTAHLLKRALSYDPDCVRASIQQGHLEQARGSERAALKAYFRVERQDPMFLPEVLTPIRACYTRLRQSDSLFDYLQRIAADYPSPAAAIALTDVIQEHYGADAAAERLIDMLHRTPSLSGLARLIRLSAERSLGEARANLETLQHAFADLLARYDGYECRRCGFSGRTLYWLCPSCRSWGTIKPVAY